MLFLILVLLQSDPYVERSGNTLTAIGAGELLSSHFAQYPIESIINVTLIGVTILGEKLFNGFKNLLYLKIPDSVTTVKNQALANTGLEIIDIGMGATQITTSYIIYLSTNVVSINVDSKNPNFRSIDGILYDKNCTILYCLPPKSKSKLKEGITTLDTLSIYQYNSNELVIPDSVTTLKSQSLADCYNVYSLIFTEKSKLKSIPQNSLWRVFMKTFQCPPLVETISSVGFFECQLVNFSCMKNSTLRVIQSGAFTSCSKLSYVFLPKTIEVINDAFASCQSLILIEVEDGNLNFSTYEGSLYSSDFSSLKFVPPNIKDIKIHSNTNSISQGIFQLCPNLFSVTFVGNNENLFEEQGVIYRKKLNDREAISCIGGINKTVLIRGCTTLSPHLFEYCKKLITIEFDKECKIKEIPIRCFAYCSVKEVILPASITSIHKEAFKNSLVQRIVLQENISSIDSNTFSYTSYLQEIKFANNSILKTINEGAFIDCACKLIELPNSLESLSRKMFLNCKIQRFRIPNKCKSISESCFQQSAVQEITVGDCPELTFIDYFAFGYCKELKSIQLPSSLASVSRGIFTNCSLLTTIEWIGVPNVTAFPAGVFSNCISLVTFEVPLLVTSMTTETFIGCTSLVNFTLKSLSNTFSTVDGVLFDKSGQILKVFPPGRDSYTIPSNTKEIEAQAFYHCSKLRLLEFAPGCEIRSIEEKTFFECIGLESLSFQLLMSRIESNAFEGCKNLRSIKFEDGSEMTSIGANVFVECESLEKLSFLGTNSLQSIGNKAFGGCKSLIEIDFGIGSHIKTIPNECFIRCSSLERISLPSTVNYLGDSAFERCSALKSVDIHSPIFSIGSDCFSSCNSLTNLSFNDNFESKKLANYSLTIKDRAFSGCSSLKEIRFPDYLESVETGVFDGCTSIETIYYCGYNYFDSSIISSVSALAYVMRGYSHSKLFGLPVLPVMKRCNMLPTSNFSAVASSGCSVSSFVLTSELASDFE